MCTHTCLHIILPSSFHPTLTSSSPPPLSPLPHPPPLISLPPPPPSLPPPHLPPLSSPSLLISLPSLPPLISLPSHLLPFSSPSPHLPPSPPPPPHLPPVSPPPLISFPSVPPPLISLPSHQAHLCYGRPVREETGCLGTVAPSDQTWAVTWSCRASNCRQCKHTGTEEYSKIQNRQNNTIQVHVHKYDMYQKPMMAKVPKEHPLHIMYIHVAV